jgi:hypothetical protein
LRVRSELVRALLEDRGNDEEVRGEDPLLSALLDAIIGYENCWDYEMLSAVKTAGTNPGGERGFLSRLPRSSRWQPLFDQLAGKFGWLHPGLLLVGETVAFIWGEEMPPAEHRVQTWVLFAKADRDSPDGVLGRLTLERIPHGCGAFVPHPLRGGYLITDKTFQAGLQNAWLASVFW